MVTTSYDPKKISQIWQETNFSRTLIALQAYESWAIDMLNCEIA
jgi:hypothetical protein